MKFAQQFQDLKKVWKMEIKSGKMAKKVLSFFASTFAAVHHEEKLCSFIDHLFDNLESGERNYCCGKKSGKSLEF